RADSGAGGLGNVADCGVIHGAAGEVHGPRGRKEAAEREGSSLEVECCSGTYREGACASAAAIAAARKAQSANCSVYRARVIENDADTVGSATGHLESSGVVEGVAGTAVGDDAASAAVDDAPCGASRVVDDCAILQHKRTASGSAALSRGAGHVNRASV